MISVLYFISFILFVLLMIIACCLYKRAYDINPLNYTLLERSAELESLMQEIGVAHSTLTGLKDEQKSLNVEKSIAEIKISEGVAMRKYIDENQGTEANLKRLIDKVKFDLKDIQDKMNLATQAKQQLDEEIQKNQGTIDSQKAEISTLGLEKHNLENQLESATSSLEANKEEIENKKDEIAKMRKDFNSLDADCKGLAREKENLEKEIKSLKNSNSSLANNKIELENNINDLEDRRSKMIPAIREIEANQEHIKKTAQNKWNDLEKGVPFVKIEKPNEPTQKKFLEAFKDSLKKSKIIFDERIINAFHTSLKVQESSALVVLAGTSGTGKSLLPKLYAEFLGMQFLPIAVQPRWDSPQDMFGFYNYMEQQFKATELSRLLWSSDIYNNDKCQIKSKEKLPMNMVLLDEMNLARVEYYFSDMLSKLELRRGIDESNEDKRKAAEIELECPRDLSGVKPRRLYVGKNTLFIGTMNEDESTQSLSDKVMDRANVMRFGRPKELNIIPDLKTFSKLCQEQHSQINMKNWELFKNLDTNVNPRLKDLANNINDALDSIGRPFAHRVWQAMSTYVNNYPVTTKEGITAAIADQIEMKLLPKLNGLEKDENSVKKALDSIAEEIYKLEDKELSEAFKSAKDNDNNVFFQWRGIKR